MLNSACPTYFTAAPMRRREFLRAGSLGLVGLTLPQLIQARATAAETVGRPRVKACILLFMWGGPAQQDTWDPKPDAPADYRGEFKPISTSVPGLQICEHLPRLARAADKLTVIRSLTHPDVNHTTATHYLLAIDPQFRYLRKWELVDPVPPPDLATEHADPRRPEPSNQENVLHIATVDGPAEDRRIHELSFHESPAVLGVPSYAEYWRTADHAAAFPYHERVLRLLHSRRPPYRWLLKSPESMHTLAPLAAHYPEMRFVLTHRDPVKVIPSACSVIAEHTRMRLPDWDPDPEFGRRTLTQLLEGVQRAMAARPAIGEERFVDIGQPELNADAVAVAERIYDFAGLELDDEVRSAMAAWSEQNRAGARGEHHYTAEEFGLTEDEIRSAFAEYLDRFGAYCPPKP